MSDEPPNATSLRKDSLHEAPRIPTKLCPQPRFRFKGTKLQQAMTDPRGGMRVYWQDVPTVAEDESDVS